MDLFTQESESFAGVIDNQGEVDVKDAGFGNEGASVTARGLSTTWNNKSFGV